MLEMQLEIPSVELCVEELVNLALAGLPRMIDPERQLFCHTLHQSQGMLVREGVSHRYTMMTLLGLRRVEMAGGKAPIRIDNMLGRLTADTSWVSGVGDLGLLLWTCALVSPERLPELCHKVGARDALQRHPDARQRNTMELAWYLTGVAQSLNTGMQDVRDLSQQAWDTFAMLKANQGERGVFGHQAPSRTIQGLLRGRIGSFADQVYPIYALAEFSKYARKQEIVDCALECARTICRHQGPNGEWWWHYDASTGDIVETYPVYSVHQDGMAPMALFALAEVSGIDFTSSIKKGLNWIYGNNDLKVDMRSESGKLVWRNFFLPESTRYWRQIVRTASRPATTPVYKLRVNYECRPYELGWALYALAGRETS
jgi:hypothetical protein